MSFSLISNALFYSLLLLSSLLLYLPQGWWGGPGVSHQRTWECYVMCVYVCVYVYVRVETWQGFLQVSNHLVGDTHSDTLMRTLTSAYPINNIKNTWHIKWGMISLLQACLPSNCERSASPPPPSPCQNFFKSHVHCCQEQGWSRKGSQFLTSTPQHCLWHFRNHPKSHWNFIWKVALSKPGQMPKPPTSHYHTASFCQNTSDMSIYLAAVPKWCSWLVWWFDAILTLQYFAWITGIYCIWEWKKWVNTTN